MSRKDKKGEGRKECKKGIGGKKKRVMIGRLRYEGERTKKGRMERNGKKEKGGKESKGRIGGLRYEKEGRASGG